MPRDAVETGRKAATDLGADCLISYGGGSSVGLAKAIALELDIPIISIATTYSGSETTALQGIVGRDGVRTNYRSMRMLPKCLIYDAELTVALPLDISIPSGFNAISHAISSFLGESANPVAELFAEAGIAAMSSALAEISEDPANIDARGRAFYGSWLCGLTVMSAGTTIHHKIVHVLGTGYGLPHGPTHAVVLPHSTAYNRDAAPEAMRRIARALGGADPIGRALPASGAQRRGHQSEGLGPALPDARRSRRQNHDRQVFQSPDLRARRDPGPARRRLARQAACGLKSHRQFSFRRCCDRTDGSLRDRIRSSTLRPGATNCPDPLSQRDAFRSRRIRG